jgi:hypothetical protein
LNVSVGAAQTNFLQASIHVGKTEATATEASIQLTERDYDYASNDGVVVVEIKRPPALKGKSCTIGLATYYFDANGNNLPDTNGIKIPLPAEYLCPFVRSASGNWSHPLLVAVNSFQGDFSPLLRINDSTTAAFRLAAVDTPTLLVFAPDEDRKVIELKARLNDKGVARRYAYSYLSERLIGYDLLPNRQGNRAAVFALVPLFFGEFYTIDSMAAKALVGLNDRSTPPYVVSIIQNRLMEAGREEIMELESLGCNYDQKIGIEIYQPLWVFFDADYDKLTYSVTSSDTSVVNASVLQRDARFDGRPSLIYRTSSTARPGQQATITVTANTTTGTAQTAFIIIVGSKSITTQASEATFEVLPNPAQERLEYIFQSQQTGVLSGKIMDVYGAVLSSMQRSILPNERVQDVMDISKLPAGVYVVEFTLGAERFVRRIVKQ